MKRPKLAVFAGTTEGRLLCERLAAEGMVARVFVASPYGEATLPPLPGFEVCTGRLDTAGMEGALAGCLLVADATHPYAEEASGNIRAASKVAGARYMQVVRPAAPAVQDAVRMPGSAAAAEFLRETQGNILLATGSKELAAYMHIPRCGERVYARVLPDAEVVRACRALGLPPSNLICMQGPFSHELNVALLRHVQAKWLVTKDSGAEGGFEAKVTAAREAGARLVLIERPEAVSQGYSTEEVLLAVQELAL